MRMRRDVEDAVPYEMRGMQRNNVVIYGIPTGVGGIVQNITYPSGTERVVKLYYHDRLGSADLLTNSLGGDLCLTVIIGGRVNAARSKREASDSGDNCFGGCIKLVFFQRYCNTDIATFSLILCACNCASYH